MPNSVDMNDSDDEFIVVEDDLPIRPKISNGQDASNNNGLSASINSNSHDVVADGGLSLHLHPIHASNEILISIQPPKEPDHGLRHTSCDVVLVIDISGSMGAGAELPDNIGTNNKEVSGLHILDLVRHAARTILESLTDNDRLAIVTFSERATKVQDLSLMTETGKKHAWASIEKLQPDASTNLWAGIREGLALFNSNQHVGNVQSMFILTDGAPNYMCPSQGYVKKLQPMLKEMEANNGHAPTLSTFGFGYYLRSDLLRSIAEVGRGSYAFIPDSGMIGTVFVHAVANLFSTFATSAKLRLQVQSRSAGMSVPKYLEFETDKTEDGAMIHVERLQYGQTRDIIAKLDNIEDGDIISCTLDYKDVTKDVKDTVTARKRFSDISTVSQALLDYHLSRHELCNFLASFAVRNKNDEHVNIVARTVVNSDKTGELGSLIKRIKSRLQNAHEAKVSEEEISLLQSILADIENPDLSDNPHGGGQISLAIQTEPPVSNGKSQPAFYNRWGKHYLPSVLHAHMRQQCATFKDEGPLIYGSKSPLFIKCRDDLDKAFDKLPAPKPSLKGQNVAGGVLRMSRYNSRSNPCFAEHCLVKMADGSGHKRRVDELRVGDELWTPAGGRRISAIVKTNTAYSESAYGKPQPMYEISNGESSGGSLWITPYHPIQFQGKWTFPIDVAPTSKPVTIMRSGYIYSMVLEKDWDSNAHVIDVGGVRCVTLGHGMTSFTTNNFSNEIDVRTHPYLGDYDRIHADLEMLGEDDCGRRICGGLGKGGEAGLAEMFVRPDYFAQAPLPVQELGCE